MYFYLKFKFMKLQFLIALLLFLGIVSCKKYDINGKIIKNYEELNASKWLLGEWQKEDSIGTLHEKWILENDSTLMGSSYFINKKKDTIHSEIIELMENQEHLIYKATVKGENNNNPIPFLLKQKKDSLLVFENPKHAYPNKIVYRLISEKSILATVYGKVNGKISYENYSLTKKKSNSN